ncbi:metallo-beta-lactamase superfamily protein [Metarhizium guizhouense ARSEF 977]|uniref:Metallo-beta-lactamase superfamily protein n=1 Tax=Metarhizium guizhouense (strain ARSEF 977) TaxID=1276136 RepID=A0A0B4G4I6_METGA|nr:metallo-beta-lactamase superfamily protein [Metarhizium guizhouense ARSEF 977]
MALPQFMSEPFANASVPAFQCPPGTKMHILDLGTLRADEGWILQGANGCSQSDPNPPRKTRDLVVLSALIEHAHFGLILFETGCAENLEIAWGTPYTDVFPRIEYTEDHKLPAAIKATGNDIKDVKAVIMGHLHIDHAGGLEHFLGTDVPIYVHEDEFKHACWAVATGADLGTYLGHYMQLEKLNWQTFNESQVDLCQGITLHHCPGHTPGLVVMQVNLARDGTFIWTTDQFHVEENYHLSQPHGWLARDVVEWVRSKNRIKRLQRNFDAHLIFGHDKTVAEMLKQRKKFFE